MSRGISLRPPCATLALLLYIVYIACLCPSPAQAEEPRPQVLDTVVVNAQRHPLHAIDAKHYPGHVTVITAQAIADSGADSLPALLQRLVGIHASDSIGFGLGSDATVNLRGVVNSARTGAAVLVDGVRQNRITGDEVHWQSIPLEDIERIEVLRGGSGILYGEGALAGVINIITKKGAERPLVMESGAELGSFGRRHGYVSSRGSAENLTYGTSYHRSQVTGYRESTNARTTTVTAHLGIDALEGLSIAGNVLHSEDTSRYTGGLTPAQSEQRRRQTGNLPGFFDDETNQVSLNSQWEGPAGFALASTAFYRERMSDSVTASGRFTTLTPSQGLTLSGSHDAALTEAIDHTLIAGIDLLDEKASTGNRTGSYAESNKSAYGLFAEETLQYFERLTFTAGVRYDKARFEEALTFPVYEGTLRFSGWSPKLGVRAVVLEELSLFASYARPFKSPNVDDFSAFIPGGTFIGNVDIQPQQGDEYEIGLQWQQATLGSAHVSVFHKRVDDEILFNALTFQNQNYDTRRTGLEVSLDPKLPIAGLTSSWHYTFLEAEFRKGSFKGNTLPGVPEHALKNHTAYEPLEGLLFWWDWTLINDFFRINDFANALPGDNYGLMDVGVRFTYRDTTVFFTIENVTDEEYTSFQSSNGTTVATGENPAPPRAYLTGITWQF